MTSHPLIEEEKAAFAPTLDRLAELTRRGALAWEVERDEPEGPWLTPPPYPSLTAAVAGLRLCLEDERRRIGPYEPDHAWLRAGRWPRYRLVIAEAGRGVPLVSPPMRAATDLAVGVLGEGPWREGEGAERAGPERLADVRRRLGEALGA